MNDRPTIRPPAFTERAKTVDSFEAVLERNPELKARVDAARAVARRQQAWRDRAG